MVIVKFEFFSHLPVQCLCEFLLSSNEKQQGKYQELLKHLQTLLTDANKNPNIVCEILDHFLRRLGSHANKEQAISVSNEFNNEFIFHKI